MGYIPQHALENLRKYSYKGVDKCVIITCHTASLSPRVLLAPAPTQVARLALRPPAVLGLAGDALADVGRP